MADGGFDLVFLAQEAAYSARFGWGLDDHHFAFPWPLVSLLSFLLATACPALSCRDRRSLHPFMSRSPPHAKKGRAALGTSGLRGRPSRGCEDRLRVVHRSFGSAFHAVGLEVLIRHSLLSDPFS